MTTQSRQDSRFCGGRFIGILLAVASAILPMAMAATTGEPTSLAASGTPSFVMLSHDGMALSGPLGSRCDASGCSHTLGLSWTPGMCDSGYEFPHVFLGWDKAGKINTKVQPVLAPCGVMGLRVKWTTSNIVAKAVWIVSGTGTTKKIPVPKRTDSFNAYWLEGAAPAAAGWATPSSSIPLAAGTNGIRWFGYDPMRPAAGARAGIVRRAISLPQLITTSGTGTNPKTPPKGAAGVRFEWTGTCDKNGEMSPPVTVVFSKDGTSIGTPSVLKCACNQTDMTFAFVFDPNTGLITSADGLAVPTAATGGPANDIHLNIDKGAKWDKANGLKAATWTDAEGKSDTLPKDGAVDGVKGAWAAKWGK